MTLSAHRLSSDIATTAPEATHDTPVMDADAILTIAQDVVTQELRALEQLVKSIHTDFTRAVDTITRKQGRVIVSGIGKSGHVARKIAATLASTGQPAYFVHAAEASHGDLGMVTAQDTLLLLSNSGQARELHALIHYGLRLQMPIIAITSNKDSFLGSHATVVLTLPAIEEACPMGLAPTTSTTMMMALGDALAVTLLKIRHFDATDFKQFHPGGQLGFQLKSVRELMHSTEAIPFAAPDTPLHICIDRITHYGFGCLGILNDEKRLVGIITDGDIRRFLSQLLTGQTTKELSRIVARDVMKENPITIRDTAVLGEALALFEQKAITNVFVRATEEETKAPQAPKIIGLVHIHDCLKQKAI